MTKKIIKFCLCTMTFLTWTGNINAQVEPTANPVAIANTASGDVEIGTEKYSAPLTVSFYANPENAEDWQSNYEWRFTREGESEPYLIRYEQDTQYTFTEARSHVVELYATYRKGEENVVYDRESSDEKNIFRITIAESKLEFPNAFSPNGDQINDIYRAKKGWESIVEFSAYIFNRWGQKLYEWHDPAGGWDGKYNGKDVKEGVYYVLVKAKGADGKSYNIKKDVNLLRRHGIGDNANR